MGFGIRMRELWQMRVGVIACTALALLAAVWSLDRVSGFPPALTPRVLDMATASTQVVVDTPRSALLDLRRDTFSLEALTNRAVLLGNVMASGSVRESIASRAHVPPGVLQVAPPLTEKQPRALAEDGNERHTTDILKLNDQYRLNIQANPTVPVLHIYAQAPTAASAAALANAAVDVLSNYLTDLAQTDDTPANQQIRLVQLGRAQGHVIDHSAGWQGAFLAFILTFAASCATLIFAARVRQGWKLASLSERTARPAAD